MPDQRRLGHMPAGYKVFELPWRGCWHYRRGDDEAGTSKCYDSEEEAARSACEDFERVAAMLRAAATC